MPSVDDLLHQSFDTLDEEWVRRAPAARDELHRRHRRYRSVRRRTVGGALAAAALTVAVTVADGEPHSRGAEPAEPVVTRTAPAPSTPLEGRWISALLDEADVRSAARRAGAPGAADRMLDQLPATPFRVVLVVRGSSLRTSVRTADGRDTLMDEESISTTGSEVELRPSGAPGGSAHRWAVQGPELTIRFGSTTEGVVDGVPGGAWQHLLYASATFTR